MIRFVSLIRKIHVHPLMWLVVALSVVTAHFIDLSILFFIILIHELGHATAAAFFSWRIKRISILPFGGVAEMDEHGNRPFREDAIVTLSGPIQHIWLIVAAFFLYEIDWIPGSLFWTFTQYNFMIFFFNLLPIWPLDGGKLLFLWLSLYDSFPKAFKKTLVISIIATSIFVIFILFIEPFNLNIWMVLLFLIYSLYFEWKQSRYVFVRFLLERYYGKSNDFRQLKPIVVEEEELIIHVLERFQRGCKHPIIIAKDGNEKASLDENEILHAYFADKLITAKVGDLLYPY